MSKIFNDVTKGEFLFVSYSHKNADIVREDVNKLHEKGVCLWIDHKSEDEHNINVGEHWQNKVEKIINHENCKGAILYISGYSLASKAVYIEQNLIYERFKNTPTNIIIVSVDGLPIRKHYSAANELCDDENSRYFNEEYGYIESIRQKEFINDKIDLIFRKDQLETIDKIYTVAARLGVVDHIVTIAMPDTKLAISDKVISIQLGVFKTTKTQPIEHSGSNCRFTSGGIDYIDYKNEVYKTKKLNWLCMYANENYAALICSEILSQKSAIGINEYLKTLYNLLFSEKEKNMIQTMRLFNLNDEEFIKSKEERDLMLTLPDDCDNSWWIDNTSKINPSWQLVYKNNKLYGPGFLKTLKKGVRPVIVIQKNILENYIREAK